MSIQTADHTADCLFAIERLPAGAMLRLDGITWDEYERLLAGLSGRPGLRAAYDTGRIEIVSPTHEHEIYKALVSRAVHVMAEELEVPVELSGATTFKRKELLKGAEPDESFYVKNAAAIIGKTQIDLAIDPPPDVVVEIDVTSESESKFPIYAALGVAEIWRFNGERAWMYELRGNQYIEIDSSLVFPILTLAALAQVLKQGKTQGQSAALATFRQWVRAQIEG